MTDPERLALLRFWVEARINESTPVPPVVMDYLDKLGRKDPS